MDMTNAGLALAQKLEPIAAYFRALDLPGPITHWGHPLMMGIVVLAMGSSAAYAGWAGRLSQDDETKRKKLTDHSLIAKLMFGFISLGYTGGLLSLVMQKQPILQSPHFWTGSVVIALLATNSLLSKVFSDRAGLRKTHAYLGSATLAVMFTHALLGLKLGLSF